jgi:DNA polymerase/3'-5' exonuclease PolX
MNNNNIITNTPFPIYIESYTSDSIVNNVITKFINRSELGKTKYMGFGKYLDNPVRRIDIRFVPYESYFSALLYFTGSAELNKQMRQIAKLKNLTLSEYGLFKENGEKFKINDETIN